MRPLEVWDTRIFGTSLPRDYPAAVELGRRHGLGPKEARRRLSARPLLVPYLNTSGVRPLIVVMPGGGYVHRALSEGRPVCRWLNGKGLHCAVLEYRLLRKHPGPLLDARRAIQLVRYHANAWRVDRSAVGVLGFSAGGHLAGHAALAWDSTDGAKLDERLVKAGDDVSRLSARPDVAVLAYPVVSAHNDSVGVIGAGVHTCSSYACVGRARRGQNRPLRHHGSMAVLLGQRLDTTIPRAAEVSLEDIAATRQTPPPPMFIWHTASDEKVPCANSERLASALLRRSFEAEAFIFTGDSLWHGLGLAFKMRGNHKVGNWTELCATWLRKHLMGSRR